MIVMREITFRGPLEGVGPENQDFFGPSNANEPSECNLGPKKSRFSGPTPSNGPSNGFSRIKSIKFKHHIIYSLLAALYASGGSDYS
jgi:hypothetical protein